MTQDYELEPADVPYDHRAHRSVSQIDQYSDCGLKYKLQRVDRLPQRPAWWNIGGSAFHHFAEHVERVHLASPLDPWPTPKESTTFFLELFDVELARTIESHPDLWPAEYQAAKGGKEGDDWWRENGPLMAVSYVEHRRLDPRRILVLPDRTPAIELEFMLDVEGVPVKGYIDQVLIYPNNDLEIRDLKAGARQPSGTFQLAMYWWAFLSIIAQLKGHDEPRLVVPPQGYGRYYMARKGTDTFAVDFANAHPWEEIVYWVHTMDRAERAELYLPRVSSFCQSCAVKDQCPTKTGVWS